MHATDPHPLLAAVEVLLELGLPHCLIGGYAVAIHGEPRTTRDLDFLVQGSREDMARLARTCTARGWEAELRTSDLLDPVGDVVRIHAPFFCDFLRARPGLEEECVREAVSVSLFGREIATVTPEHLILLLLRAGDPRSLYDAYGVLEVQRHGPGRLDEGALQRKATRYRLNKRLNALLSGRISWRWAPKF